MPPPARDIRSSPKGPITLGISAPTSGALASYGILTKILNDGIPYDTVFANQIGAGVKKSVKNAKVTTVNITPGAGQEELSRYEGRGHPGRASGESPCGGVCFTGSQALLR